MPMIVDPLLDRALLRRVEPEKKTKEGIVVPDTAQEKQMLADVIAVGEGVGCKQCGDVEPAPAKVGDRVLIGQYAGTEIVIDEEKHVVVKWDEILGVVREPGETRGKEES